jgi:glutamate N-acetyltransferase/amino-acid N-acetyltransferase
MPLCGKSSLPEITVGSEAMQQFQQAIQEACAHLAEAIIRDGEGATKLIKIKVSRHIGLDHACAFRHPGNSKHMPLYFNTL